MTELFIAENPHLVIQGEGPFLGKKMVVVRLFGCDVFCKNCDSKHTWTNPEENRKTVRIVDLVEEVVSLCEKNGVDWVMVTGGAPILQQEGLKEFVDQMVKKNTPPYSLILRTLEITCVIPSLWSTHLFLLSFHLKKVSFPQE